ncbi:hypothetical protein B566_EDAN008083, partial [Ephemera danica]
MATEEKAPSPTPVKKQLIAILPPAVECSHAPCYCEENVWQLCASIRQRHPAELSRCHVVFVSNEARIVPLWRQKAGRDEEKLVIWVSCRRSAIRRICVNLLIFLMYIMLYASQVLD